MPVIGHAEEDEEATSILGEGKSAEKEHAISFTPSGLSLIPRRYGILCFLSGAGAMAFLMIVTIGAPTHTQTLAPFAPAASEPSCAPCAPATLSSGTLVAGNTCGGKADFNSFFKGVFLRIPDMHATLGTKGARHSQSNQDWLVGTFLNCRKDGYFVDLAANDAIHISNSLMLERDFGWRGLCVEANPQYLPNLMTRKCNVLQAAVSSPTGMNISFGNNAAYGKITGPRSTHLQGAAMTTISLMDILDSMRAPATIDYFSLDVEGAEAIVMDGFDFAQYRFLVFMIERPPKTLQEKLEANGYHKLLDNKNIGGQDLDIVYVHKSIPELETLKAKWQDFDWRKNDSTPAPASCMTDLGYEGFNWKK